MGHNFSFLSMKSYIQEDMSRPFWVIKVNTQVSYELKEGKSDVEEGIVL